jgi:tRNA pseudouridine65 synthase
VYDPSATVILFRDEHIIAADKASGLLVHRGWGRDRDVLMARVRDAVGFRVHPLHRLDRGASGVVLFASHAEAARRMGALFAERRVDKVYLALVRGSPPARGSIDHPLERREGGPRLASRTDYQRIAQWGRYALMKAQPASGRLHQIRRHFKHIACPLIGDVRYGKGEHNRLFRERYALCRLALHACAISFVHPFSGEPSTIRAPLPPDRALPLGALARDCGSELDVAALSDEAREESFTAGA